MINQLIILQPINLCNLNCSYCYVPGRRDSTKMGEEILETSIKLLFNSPLVIHNNILTILWHAGEPMAVGIEYYQKAVELIQKYNVENKKLVLAIQTNATIINQEWCDFFKKYNFEVGISIDGPKFIHDKQRRDWNNRGSFDRVLRGAKLLQENGMDLNAIVVLTNDSLDYPEEIYQFFKNNKFTSFGFNIDENESIHTSSSFSNLSANHINRFKNFLSKLYDLWVQDHRAIEIREFIETFNYFAFKKDNQNSHILSTDATAFSIITITKNGDINTFSPEMAGGIATNEKEFTIGNVLNIASFDELVENANFKKQLQGVLKGIENCANSCNYFELCGGGSPSNKYYEKGTFEATETMYCKLSKQTLIDVIFEKTSLA
ncbi:MAG: cyclophane-forming radical SAM/SPASM peptide maturase GrrM/OscB [Pseudomonadota bacterium]